MTSSLEDLEGTEQKRRDWNTLHQLLSTIHLVDMVWCVWEPPRYRAIFEHVKFHSCGLLTPAQEHQGQLRIRI
jgi:hypothetical protein